MEGIDVFDTHAHLVSMITVRLLSVFSFVLKLDTQRMDHTNVLFQDLIDQTVYVELFRSFGVPNIVLHLRQSVYGL